MFKLFPVKSASRLIISPSEFESKIHCLTGIRCSQFAKLLCWVSLWVWLWKKEQSTVFLSSIVPKCSVEIRRTKTSCCERVQIKSCPCCVCVCVKLRNFLCLQKIKKISSNEDTLSNIDFFSICSQFALQLFISRQNCASASFIVLCSVQICVFVS